MPSSEHKTKASELGPIKIALVTVSDTRTKETDVNGKYLCEEISSTGNVASAYHIVKDEPKEVEQVLEDLSRSEAQVILFNGGTGVAKRDNTFDVLSSSLEKTLPGFGELFRLLSFKQIGSAAMLSRAVAGIYRGRVVFSTPGSPKAVVLAWEELIKPELQHLVWTVK